MTIGKDQNTNRFENWQLCGVWKLPFCGHRSIKPTHNNVSLINPCINLMALCLPSIVNTTPRRLNLSTCCSVLSFTCRMHCLGFVERHSTSILLVLIFILARSHAAENRSSACWRVLKWLVVPNRPQKVNCWSCSSRLRHPHRLRCRCLSNSWIPVVLKHSALTHPLCDPQQSFHKKSDIFL